MSDSPWLTLRHAQEAVANHRPEDAHKLVEPLISAGYRRAWRLAREIAREYAARAAKFLDQHNPDGAWRDLLAAEAMNTGEKMLVDLRQTLTRLGMVQARTSLEAGKPHETIATVGKLRDRGVRHPDLGRLEESAQDWAMAEELADRGEFLRSIADMDRLRPKLPCPVAALDRLRQAVEDRHQQFVAAVSKLYDAAEARHWREALHAAETVLSVAPEHREAKAIRGKAWLAASPDTADYLEARDRVAALTPQSPPVSNNQRLPSKPAADGLSSSRSGHSSTIAIPKRFLLWVDGIGGYLVCLSNRVTFGQATGDGPIDVPLFADVSRLHAEITRDGEGYVVESVKAILVNGREATRSTLAPGDRVTLGATCQFLFHKPVAMSSTARLELTSGHRLPVAVDGVLLMGNEVMLGPGPDAHVVIPQLPTPVLIYRSKDGLGVRAPNCHFRVEDQACNDRAALPLPSVVTSESFTFAVEPVVARW